MRGVMKTYTVSIFGEVEVEAENENEALAKAEAEFDSSDINSSQVIFVDDED